MFACSYYSWASMVFTKREWSAGCLHKPTKSGFVWHYDLISKVQHLQESIWCSSSPHAALELRTHIMSSFFFFFGRLYFKPLLQNFAPYVASSKSLLVTCFSAWTGTCRDRCLLSFEPLVFFYWLLLGCLWPKCHPPFVHTLDMHLA